MTHVAEVTNTGIAAIYQQYHWSLIDISTHYVYIEAVST